MSPKLQARRAMALTLGYDTLTALISMWLAVELRGLLSPIDERPFPPYAAVLAAVIFAGSAALAMTGLQVHRQVWRHAGFSDALRVVQAAGLTALIFLPSMFLWNRLVGFPRSSLLIALTIWLGLLFIGRMVALARSTQRPFQIFMTFRKDAPMAVLVGEPEDLVEALRGLQRTDGGAPIRPLALVGLSEAHPGLAIRGVTMMGDLQSLDEVLDVLSVRYGEIPWIGVVGEARQPAVMSRVLEIASPRGVKTMVLAEGEGGGTSLTRVRPADLLARPVRHLNIQPVDTLIRGCEVLVTGAGGTIGSELVRQCIELDPAGITLIDACEYNLYAIEMELRELGCSITPKSYLADVRDFRRIVDIMSDNRPDIVLHSAALKHVPLMERNPIETVRTNIGGTVNVARAAIQCGAKRFVQISTDKAVDPQNVMGATKRLAELALTRLCLQSQMALAMVRFGNVLGSSGSVVPLFERQIERGGPVTVTDPKMTRYFMTVEEASALVLQAAAQQSSPGNPGLFVLDMGSPVKIADLAEAMIRLKGAVPGKDVQIEYTGLRPGEKMHEILTFDYEQLSATSVDGVMRVVGTPDVQADFQRDLDRLLARAEHQNEGEVLSLLSKLVREYEAPGELRPTGKVLRLRR